MIRTFYHDIVIKNQDTLIDHILTQLASSPSKYEVKLHLIKMLYSILEPKEALRLLTILKKNLEE
jgi:hypothetical protein